MKGRWRQAQLSARTAHEALRLGDTVSCASRAYYAMFDAARAALAAIDPELPIAKTHATILRRFSRHVVVERGLDEKHARALRSAFGVRQVADYDVDPPRPEHAARMLDEMSEFIAAIQAMFAEHLD